MAAKFISEHLSTEISWQTPNSVLEGKISLPYYISKNQGNYEIIPFGDFHSYVYMFSAVI